MKDKKINVIVVIAVCLIVMVLVFLTVNHFMNKNSNNEEEEKIVLTENSKVFKNIVLEVDNSFEYKELDEYSLELKKDNWTAILAPFYDESNYIFDYPKCTLKFFNSDKTKTSDDYIKENSEEHKYLKFPMIKDTDNGKENSVIVHYDLGNKYVMYVKLRNSENSTKEDGLEDVLKVLSTVRISSKGKYDYYEYSSDFYHQCHDIDEYDKEDFEKNNKIYEEGSTVQE